MQIVIGLLTDEYGYPLSVRVFEGNTTDSQTVFLQIKKLAKSFGVKEVIFIGDKGMIKTAQILDLSVEDYLYISSITKPQINTLLEKNVLRLSLFDKPLSEVESEEEFTTRDNKKITQRVRYVLRKNPIRVKEMEQIRLEKQKRIQCEANKQNDHLATHKKAAVEIAEKNLQKFIEKLKCPWIGISKTDRVFSLTIDEKILTKEKLLDGCYVIKTNCFDADFTKEIIHDRYKDLKYVEYAFRTIKTGFLEVRPIFLRKEQRTRGHILVTMLAYLLIHEFKNRTKDITGTLDYKVDSLDKVQTIELMLGEHRVKRVPQTNPFVQEILTACKIKLPVFCSI